MAARCLCVALVVGACSSPAHPPAAPAPSRALALVHANVVDTTGGPTLRDATVVLQEHRIARVDRGPAPAGAQVVDVTGRFLIPGLWDMHVHMFSNEAHPDTDLSSWAFPLFVANGVTGVRDMWSDPDDIKVAQRWNTERMRGTLIAPYVEWTSEIVDGVPPDHPNGVAVGTADEARRAVDQLQASGSTFIKVYWNLPRDAFFAIADETKRRGISFGGHVPWTVSVFEASNAGMKSIEHLTGVLESCSPHAAEFQKARKLTPELMHARWDSFDEKQCRDGYPTFVKNHTWHVPTLALMKVKYVPAESSARSSSLAYARLEDLADWSQKASNKVGDSPDVRRIHFARLLSIVRDMSAAGVGILAGTDLGNEYMVPGFSLHDELDILVEAGLTPLQALQAATRNVGLYFGRSDIGTVAPGSIADLVILDADPMLDIANTRRIAGVVLDGRYLDRAALDRLMPPQHATN